MTRNQYIKSLQEEISKLNRKIDRKIMYGQNYFFEALRHKFLLKQLKKHHSEGILSKLFVSFF